MRSKLRTGAALALCAVALGACSAQPELEQSGSPIFGGSVEEGYAPVGYLRHGTSSCSATLLRADAVVTAFHCVVTRAGAVPPALLRFGLGNVNAPLRVSAVRKVALHPEGSLTAAPHDLAVVFLETPFWDVEVATLGAASQPGCVYRLVGEGRSDRALPGLDRKSLLACLLDEEGGVIHTQVEGAGSCPGDSGGALFLDGTLELVGVHRGSMPTCTASNKMTAVSVERERPFIEKVLRDEPAPPQEPAGSTPESARAPMVDPSQMEAEPPALAPSGGCTLTGRPCSGSIPLLLLTILAARLRAEAVRREAAQSAACILGGRGPMQND